LKFWPPYFKNQLFSPPISKVNIFLNPPPIFNDVAPKLLTWHLVAYMSWIKY
jgi:hypothetical protein